MPKRKDWANMFHTVCLLKAWPDISSGPFPSLFALLNEGYVNLRKLDTKRTDIS